MTKVLTVVGARPQFIKAAVVSRALKRHPDAPTEVLVHTGQHFDAAMSNVFFEELELPTPAFSLGVGGGTNTENTARMMLALEPIMLSEQPDWVLVYGDTDSTLAGALVAAKLHIPIAHVEAGLRSFNRRMPEEINRIATDHLSTLLFAPTSSALLQLRSEGVPEDRVRLSGDVMLDATLYHRGLASERSRILEQLGLERQQYLIATIHRAENVDDEQRLREILLGMAGSPIPIVLPMHPRTLRRLAEFNLTLPPSVRASDPLGYIDMTHLTANARAVLTDSGGLQKEAFFHGVPCLTVRDETEWTELVDCGANTLVGANAMRIVEALRAGPSFPDGVPAYYGRGSAGAFIASALV